jgi:hypothetical protein
MSDKAKIDDDVRFLSLIFDSLRLNLLTFSDEFRKKSDNDDGHSHCSYSQHSSKKEGKPPHSPPFFLEQLGILARLFSVGY